MEEISNVKEKYLNLIQSIQKDNKEKDKKEYIELRKDIEKRIIEIDNFIEDNFDKNYALYFEKGKLKLMKLLQITPKDKISKSIQNKNFKDIDVYKKIEKIVQDKKRHFEEEQEKKCIKPIYNQLPENYEEMDKLIGFLLVKEQKNKKDNYKNEKKNYGNMMSGSSYWKEIEVEKKNKKSGISSFSNVEKEEKNPDFFEIKTGSDSLPDNSSFRFEKSSIYNNTGNTIGHRTSRIKK